MTARSWVFPRAFSSGTTASTWCRSRSRYPVLRQYSTGPRSTVPQAQASTWVQPLAVSGCALAGLWVATTLVYLTSSPVHLDNDATCTDHRATQDHASESPARPEYALKAQSAYVDQELRRNEKTCIAPPNSGISRYDTVCVASNEPVEDEHAEAVLPVPSGYWAIFGLFDGHSGRDTSVWLAHNLVPAVTGALADLYSRVAHGSASSTPPPTPPETDIERTLKDTFTRLDDDIVNAPLDTVFSSKSRHASVSLLAPAYSGSCALLSFYDSHSRLLHTALTGDSRAVLGRQNYDESGEPTGVYSVYALTSDQNGWNPLEQERVAAEHPGEETTRNGRFVGMGMSRAFGDARYKWSREVQWRLKREYLGRTPLPSVKTPPYLTAEPVVTSIAIRPGDFLIIASDGLWEALTNEEAVGLVGLWKEMRSSRSRGLSSGVMLDSAELPVQEHGDDGSVRYRQWGARKRFVSGDENAATHLLRNALGGADVDLAAALLSMRAPRARTYRDDITITVVFFAEDDRRTPT